MTDFMKTENKNVKGDFDGFGAGIEPCHFPRLDGDVASKRRVLSVNVDVTEFYAVQCLGSKEASNVLRTAWALVLRCYTGLGDVCFGYKDTSEETVFGKQSVSDMPVMRLKLDKEATLAQLTEKARKNILGQHLCVPEQESNDLVREVGFDQAQFNTSIIFHNRESCGASAMPPFLVTDFEECSICLHVKFSPDNVDISLQWWSTEMSTPQALNLGNTFDKMISEIITRPSKILKDLSYFSARDAESVRTWNRTPLEDVKRCIHHIVHDQAMFRPDAEAIYAHDGVISYRELDELSSRLAIHLHDVHNIGPEKFVPLCFEKSAWNVVAMLAVLKSGAAFVPLDPTAPLSRLERLSQKVGGTIILSSRNYASSLSSIGPDILAIDAEMIRQLQSNSTHSKYLSRDAESHNQAYLIFTSGTTGQPKGTVIDHSAFCSSANVHGPKMFMNSRSRVLQFAAHTFDASIQEILSTLMFGGTVCIPDEDTRLNNIVGAINEMRVNWACLTPSFVDFIVPADVPSLKTLILVGEAMSQGHITTWSPHTKLINGYGPSECSVAAVANSNITTETHPLDIGQPIGIHAWVANPDNHHTLVPVGCIGELLIEGPTLARGYLDDPRRTAESFILDPQWISDVIPGRVQCRLYKTGDLVRQNHDGTLRFVGRKDNQVKVHGQRVELGEIEHHVNSDSSIKQGLVLLPKAGNFKGRLVSIISLPDSTPSGNDIRVIRRPDESKLAQERLSTLLPSYMVPSIWITIQSIPLLASGKLDRKMVSIWLDSMSEDSYRQIIDAVESDSSHAEADKQPATYMENQLRMVWARVLNLNQDQINLSRSFLSFGGDSISALQVIGHCSKKNISLTVQDVLRAKSIKDLASRTKSVQRASNYDEVVEQPFDLSPIQQMYFRLPNQGHGHFNQSFFLRVTRPVQEQDLRHAIETVIARHSMLRARFSWSDAKDAFQQRVTTSVSSSYRIKSHNILKQSQAIPTISETQKALDPIHGPLFAVDFFNVDGSDQLLFMVGHHLVIDLVSWRVILEEIEELLLDPSKSSSTEKSLPFQTWCQMQADQANKLDLGKVLPPIDIPAGDAAFWGMEDQPNTYGAVACEGFEIDSSATSRMLTECHDTLNTEPIDLLLSALIYSFAQVFPDRSVPALYTEGHGREPSDMNANLARTIGWFTTMYPVCVPASASADPIQTVRYVKDYRRQVPHNGRPYFASRCLTDSGRDRFSHHWPLELTFNYLGQYQQLERKDTLLKPVESLAGEARGAGGVSDVGQDTPRFGLFEISAVIVQGKLRFSFTFPHKMSHQDRIRQWVSQCNRAVNTIANRLAQMSPQFTLTDFPLLSITYEDLEKMANSLLERTYVSDLTNVESIYPCSSIQEGLLLSQTRNSDLYEDHVICQLKTGSETEADTKRLAVSWQKVIDRHPTLRTLFIERVGTDDGIYDQVVLKEVPSDIVLLHCYGVDDAIRILSEPSPRDHTKEKRPPHRFTICQTSNSQIFCKVEISHTIIDGQSMSVIFRDLALAYEGILPEGSGPLYSDYIGYLQSKPIDMGIDYWKAYLADVVPCDFPVLNDGLLPSAKQLHSLRLDFDSLQLLDLQTFCKAKGFTFSNILHVAWALTLRNYTGSDDPCFGYLSSGRDAPLEGLDDAVGPYINMLVCRLRITPTTRLDQILQRVQEDYIESFPYHHTSLAEVQHALRLSGTPLFNTSLSYRKLQPDQFEENSKVSFSQCSPTYDPTEYTISINVESSDDSAAVDLAYWTDRISDGQAVNIGSTFMHCLQTIIQQSAQEVGQMNFVSEHSRQKIWNWNSSTPETINECVHRIIQKQSLLRPHSQAICSWDKNFTYAELDNASTKLANYLATFNVGPNMFVPVCFDKSAWTIVAMCAILKSGAAAVPLDAKHPKPALELRIRDVQAQIILVAPSMVDMFEGMVLRVISVSQSTLDELPTSNRGKSCNPAQPTDPCFVIYTSGSTGKPKGIVLEHRAIVTSANASGSCQGIGPGSRVLQFSAYTFDNSLAEIFTTLMRGGCVCVPSEYDRYNDLASSINKMDVNFMDLTPTVASLLHPSEVPKVRGLSLGGEPVTKENIEVWGPALALQCTYGPSECSINCTWNGELERSSEPTNIGRSIGSVSWIVDPSNHNVLQPIGCIGEILVEGPILARGYLNNPEKTSESFIVDPVWAGDRGRRMYKTGDLGRYNSDGTITYIGRRDTQVKLNGQRLELGEIEHHLKANIPPDAQSAVEMVTVGTTQSNMKTLAIFISLGSSLSGPASTQDGSFLPLTDSLQSLARTVDASLRKALPAYMVPNLFIPVQFMPMTASGKMDRRQLRLQCESLSEGQAAEYRLAKRSNRVPSTNMELQLQSLWESVLKLEPGSVRADDNFFQLGGDSIGAMRLVTAARLKGFSISVADIFQKPKLSEFAEGSLSYFVANDIPQSDPAPFSLVSLRDPLDNLLQEVASQCQVPTEAIQDLYPCSPLQAGLVALTAKIPGAYVAQNVYQLPSNIDVDRFKKAWERVYEEEVILRTRVLHTKQLGFLQAVVRDSITWHCASSIEELANECRKVPSHNGGALSRYTIIRANKHQPQFVWTAHHALYDGWCIPLLFEKVEAHYREQAVTRSTVPYCRFIKYLSNMDVAESDNFWTSRLSETTALAFPPLPHPAYQVQATRILKQTIPISQQSGASVTLPSTIRAAWALVMGVYSGNSDDVVFGEIHTGRSIPVTGIADMIGPTLTTMPTRIMIDPDVPISTFLAEVQAQTAEAMPFQHAGLQHIKRLSVDTNIACGFQNLISIAVDCKENSFCELQSSRADGKSFSSYPLALLCEVGGGKVNIDAHFDPETISAWQVERILDQFRFFLLRLNSVDRSNEKLGQISILNSTDEVTIRNWNSLPLKRLEECIHDAIEAQAQLYPECKTAIDSYDATLTYRELEKLSTRLAQKLVDQKLECNIVPFCFEKSAWAIVAIMAIMKSGRAFVPLDPAVPVARLRDIIDDTKTDAILCSPKHEALCRSLVKQRVIVVDRQTIEKLPVSTTTLPRCNSNDPAYVIFTSGSTGKPKGTVVQHNAFYTSAAAHGPALRMKSTSRVLQFASYSFDVSIMEILTTLIHGGCVCVPDEEARLNNISGFITDKGVTWAGLTPSFVQMIQPSSVPSLRTLVLGGEPMSRTDIANWADKVDLINAYGPSECAVTTTANPHITIDTNPANIGYATGSRTWIVDPNNHNRLAPVGSIGELIIEGPLAQGYLNDDKRTAEVFVENPDWIISNSDSSSVSKRRMYKTGDLVRYLSNGSMVFCKRKDTQKKVHGQRLELNEVEHFLRTDPAVQHALAIIPSAGHCQSRLVAILSLRGLPVTHQSTNSPPSFSLIGQDATSVHLSSIRQRLCERLPAYMIPSIWIVLHKLPFLPSGKLDRRQTVNWVGNMSDEVYRQICDVKAQNDHTAATEMEKHLQIIWGEILNLPPDQIGLSQSLLHLGGDSISAMQVMSRCRADGMGVTVQNILQSKSISELASCVALPEQHSFEEEKIDTPFGLSPIQKLYFEYIGDQGVQFNQSTVLRFSRHVEVDLLSSAINIIVKSHSMLRARFTRNESGTWQQRVLPHTSASYRFRSHDTTIGSLASIVEQSQKSLNIEYGPTFAVDLFNTAEGQVISLIAHHLVIDVVSWRIILQDLEDIVGSERMDVLDSFPFQTWSHLQAKHAEEMTKRSTFYPMNFPVADLAYWGMEGKPNLYGDVTTESFEINRATSMLLLGTCHEPLKTEPVDVFIASLIYSIRSVFSDRPTPAVYNEGHGREPWADSGLDLSRTVGWFTTICPLYLPSSLNGDIDLLDVIRWVKDLRKRIPDKGREYFASRLLTESGKKQFAAHWPMEVSFNYLGKLQQLERIDSLLKPFERAASTSSDIGANMPRFSLLDVSTAVLHGKVKMSFSFNRHMNHHDKIRQLISKCQSSLQDAARSLLQLKPERTLSDFPLLPLSFGGIEKLVQKLPVLGVDSLDAIEDAYPCSPMQQGILLAQTKNPELYACEFVFEIRAAENENPVDPVLFAQAWHAVVRQHTVLRTIFIDGVCQDGQVGQVVLKEALPRVVWLPKCKDDEVSALMAKQQPIAFSDTQPPHRLTLCKANTGKVFCKLEMSHAISDGTSLPILFRDLCKVYRSKVSKDIDFSPSVAPIYRDYVAYVSNTTEADINYWKSYLDGIQPCRIPPINDGLREKSHHLSDVLEITEYLQLRNFCSEMGMTLSNVLQLTWGAILQLYTGSDEVCFGYLTSGRDALIPGIQDNAVGAFINMMVCRINFTETPQISKALQRIQADFINSMEHQSCSLADVQHELQLSGVSLFNTAFTFQKPSNSHSAVEEEALIFKIIEAQDPSEYDIAVNAVATDSKLAISFSYWTHCLSQAQATNMAKTFDHVLNAIVSCRETDQALGELEFFSDHSRQQVMDWNSPAGLPERIDKRIQDLILEQQVRRPITTQAICSWDGNLTYTELDELATGLAFHLKEFGVGPESYVPICFEKSVWAVVSIIAVLKAGGAFVPLDPSYPQSRLKHIIDDVEATLVLCSYQYQGRFLDIVRKTFIVDIHSICELDDKLDTTLIPAATSTNAALILFTSGTTGLPKGTIIEHGAFCTSAINHAKGMHIYSTSRVFQFASLTFDAGIMEILTTLIVGGCICIPSDHERMNDIDGAVKRMGVNWMFSTPSLARTFNPESLPTLKTLILGGEAVSAADIPLWKGKVCLIDGYGPSETTICATTNVLLDEDGNEVETSVANIGKAVTGRTWVVDPKNHDKLMPIGCVGELIIESRGVARGYLNNEQKTAAAFVNCPIWLKNIEPRERVYKTGDLVRYNSDGSLNFITRKDTQIKLNGQRIELSEIEHHVKAGLPDNTDSTVELVSPGDGTNALAVFFSPKNATSSAGGSNECVISLDEISLPMSDSTRRIAKDLDALLARSLPAYMIPTIFVPLRQLPLTRSSRKLDRTRLRNIIETLSDRALAKYRLASDVNKRAPSTVMEKKLQRLWASVLGVTLQESIGAEDSFFRLGGDSITAMRLVVAARAEKISLTVVDIFRVPKLSDMAALCAPLEELEEFPQSELEPFTLVDNKNSVDNLLDEIVDECQVSKGLIQDAYPCSPLQEALITLSTKERGAYVAHHVFRLSASVDIKHFQMACQNVLDAVDILRTRVVHMKSSEFVQVVLKKQSITWYMSQSIPDAKEEGMNLPPANGGELSRYTIVNWNNPDNRYFVWSIHHVLYDGWSLPAIIKMVETAYFDSPATLPRSSYASFIRYLSKIDLESCDNFWKANLSGSSPLQFPQLQTVDSGRVREIEAFSHKTPISRDAINMDVTVPSVIRAAWSLLVAVYSGSDDVIFGEVLAGRDIPLSDITEIVGPALAIVPTRIQIDRQATLASFLQQVHKIATDCIPYQHAGLQRIKNLDANTAVACDFRNLLVIQPAGQNSETSLWEMHDDGSVESNFSTYPLTLECQAGNDEIGITAFYDTEVISSWAVERLVFQFDSVLRQLVSLSRSGNTPKVDEIETFSPQDKELVRGWNGSNLEFLDRCLHTAFEEQALAQPHAPAVCAWDGDLTYLELRDHATHLAHHLIMLGVGPEVCVPICMDRSVWVVVAILGILMAGGAYVPLDPTSPLSRHEGMLHDVQATLILCSPKYSDRFLGMVERSVIVDEVFITGLASFSRQIPRRAGSSNAAYVIFTSGSTGRPKGVLVEHRSVATSVWSWRKTILMKPSSRVFHFGSLAFDASVMEIFGALTFGSCVCIPSEDSRLNNVVEAIDSFKPTWLFLTPSLANVIKPSRVPSVEVLLCGGEALSTETFLKWAEKVTLVNVYGPTEAAVMVTANSMVKLRDPGNIGHAFPGGRTWITDPANHNHLTPVGCVGELLIEGSILAREYVNNEEKTSEAFIADPDWATSFYDIPPLKLCSLDQHSTSSRRLYKTGDLVKYTAEGSLMFVGRKDHQVKLRGQRIELGEIEHALDKDPHVHHGLVILPNSGPFKMRLVAVVSLNDLVASAVSGEGCELVRDGPRAATARSHITKAQNRLSELLPSYMVPKTWLALEAIPMTTSGKLERRTVKRWLESMDKQSYEEIIAGERDVDSSVAPTGISKILQQIISRVLNLPIRDVKLQSSFLSLGGDSITAMQLMALCRKEEIQFTLPEILQSKSIHQLASYSRAKVEAIYQDEQLDLNFDLSPIQQMYFEAQPEIDPKSGNHFNQSFLLKIARPIQTEKLKTAIEMLVGQHSMLRARFIKTSNGIWQQRIVQDIANSYRYENHYVNNACEVPAWISDSQRSLNIQHGPLLSVDLFNILGGDQILFLAANHLIIDMVSWRIILRDLEEILTSGTLTANKALSFQTWCAMQVEQSHKQITSGTNEILPFTVPPSNVGYWSMDGQSNNYGDVECESFTVGEGITASALGECHSSLHTEPVDLFLSAIAHSFCRIFSDRAVPTIFNENHGREPWDSGIDLSETVGWFTALYPVHVAVEPGDDVLNTVRRMKDTRHKIPDNGRPYFAHRYLTAQGRSEFKHHSGPMEIVFNYLGRMQQLEHQDSLLQQWNCSQSEDDAKQMSDVGPRTARLALIEISACVIENRIQLSFVFNRHMKNQKAIRRWISECRSTLEETVDRLMRIKSEHHFTLSDFPLLPISYVGLQKMVKETLPSVGISPQAVDDIYPCAPMQEGMLLSQLRNPDFYQFRAIFEITASAERIDGKRLVKAWQQVVDRHATLRTIFVDSVYREDVFNQVLLKRGGKQGLWITCEDEDAVEKLESLAASDTRHHEQPRLPHQFTVCETPMGRVYFKLEMNHAIMDGQSLSIMFRDLSAAYVGQLQIPGPSYRDYIAYLKRQSVQSGFQYWKTYLQNARACHFPVLNADPPSKKQLNSVKLNFSRFADLQTLCKAKNVTLANIMQAAWAVCLRSYTNLEDVCFGYLASGRDVPLSGIQDTVGPFINMLVCRVNFAVDSSLEDVFQKVQSDYLQSLEYQHCSLAQVQHDLDLAGGSLFNTAVSIQGDGPAGSSQPASISFTPVTAVDPNEYAITLNIGVTQNNEGAVLRYWTDIMSDQQADMLVCTLDKVLDIIVNNSQQAVVELDLSNEWNQAPANPPQMFDQTTQLRMIVQGCVQEILGQIFKSGALTANQPENYNLNSLVDQQITQPVATAQHMVDYSQTPISPVEIDSEDTACNSSKPEPTDHIAQQLVLLWSEFLQIPESSIRNNDSFFQLGGDSIIAMQLVGAAREGGLSLTVANVFRCPVFADMVGIIRMADQTGAHGANGSIRRYSGVDKTHSRRSSILYQNFSLLQASDVNSFLQDNVCPKIKLFRGGIVDVLPVTDFQALSITGGLLESRWMLNYFYLEGTGALDLKRLRHSIKQVVDAFEILRTVFIPYSGQFFQVVLRTLNPVFNVELTDDLDKFTAELQQRDRDVGPRLGESYLQFTVGKLRNSDNHRIIMRISHAQYDGVCLPRILDALRSAYHLQTIPTSPSFSVYLRSAVGKTTNDHYEYWESLLKDSKMTDIVRRRGPNYSRGPDPPTVLQRTVRISSCDNITPATIIKAAWSLVLAQLSADSDIIFGNVISGRNASVTGLESIVGPCVNTIPVRATFQTSWTALDLFRHLQDQQVANMPYESLGFREIIKHCTDWPDWTNFTTVCQHQNIQETPEITLGQNKYKFGGVGCQDDFADFTVLSTPKGGDDIEISLIFGLSNVCMSQNDAEIIFDTLCHTAEYYSQNPNTPLPSPAELCALPRQTRDDTTRLSERRLSSSLNALPRKDLLVYSDLLTRGWRQVLGEVMIDPESSFFDLGGDIMGLAHLVSLLDSEGFKLRLEDLVLHPVMMEQLALLARLSCPEREKGNDAAQLVQKQRVSMRAEKGSGKLWGLAKKLRKNTVNPGIEPVLAEA